MNNDGCGFTGSGTSDNRLAGMDLQHNRQTRTADELHAPVRIVTQPIEAGGPMKHQGLDDRVHESMGMRHHLEQEKMRHAEAMDHHKHHMEKHHGRHFNSQHGHDTHKYAR